MTDALTSNHQLIADAMRDAHMYIMGRCWEDDPEWKMAQRVCGQLTKAIYAMPPDTSSPRLPPGETECPDCGAEAVVRCGSKDHE